MRLTSWAKIGGYQNCFYRHLVLSTMFSLIDNMYVHKHSQTHCQYTLHTWYVYHSNLQFHIEKQVDTKLYQHHTDKDCGHHSNHNFILRNQSHALYNTNVPVEHSDTDLLLNLICQFTTCPLERHLKVMCYMKGHVYKYVVTWLNHTGHTYLKWLGIISAPFT